LEEPILLNRIFINHRGYIMETIKRPSTYFVQEALDRGLKAIKARLDPDMDNRPFFWLNLSPEPKLEHSIWDLGDMCARYVDSYILGRQVTGYKDDIDAENSLRKMLSTCDPYVNPFMATRMLIAYVDEYLQEPSKENKIQVDSLIKLIRSKMTFEDDYAYYFRQPEGWSSMDQSLGDFTPYPTYPIGGIILALSRYLESTQDTESEDLIEKLCRFVINVSGVIEKDGRYKGHTHSGGILTAIAGILRWAIYKGDKQTIELMKNAFDWTLKYSSSWGWVPDGLEENPNSGETCSLTDALHVAILLGRHVDASYFDTVERFARNQLLENQFLVTERAIPMGDFPQRNAIAKALYGSWASWSTPNSLDNCLKGVEGCCLGAGIRACYLVWNSIVEKREDKVFVNLALSRNSEWVEVIGYQPYQGRLDIIIHNAPKLRIKMPSWVRDIRASVDDMQKDFTISNGYLEADGLKNGQTLKIEYPLRKVVITEKISDQEYKVRWQGDSIVAIEPIGDIYPLYERKWMERDDTPIIDQPYKDQKAGLVQW
jgi:hypothetical protein